MKIALFFDQNNQAGGGFQQSISDAKRFISSTANYHEIVFYLNPELENKISIYFKDYKNIKYKSYKYNKIEKFYDIILYSFKTSILLSSFIKKIFKFTIFEKKFLKENIDLVYFLSPNIYSRYLHSTLYFITIWDHCSRLYPELPEVRANYRFELIEQTLATTVQKSSGIFVDSELTKKNLAKFYGISKNKISCIGVNPSPDLNLNKIDFRENLSKQNYILYPAQFWSHKNHAYIVYAIKKLKEKYGVEVFVKFTGFDKGNENNIKKLVHNLKLNKLFSFNGYVESEQLKDLYSNAIALVMPTYYGPMNLPILDAIKIRLPVFYSSIYKDDIEFKSNEITFIDLTNYSDLTDKLNQLINEPELFYKMTLKAEKKLILYENSNNADYLKFVNRTSKLVSTYKN